MRVLLRRSPVGTRLLSVPASLAALLVAALACAGPTEVEVLPPIDEGELAPAQVDTGAEPGDGVADEADPTDPQGDAPPAEGDPDATDGAPVDEAAPDDEAPAPRTGQRRRRTPRPSPAPRPTPAPRAAPGTGEAPEEEPAAPAPAPKVKPPAPAPPGITQVNETTWNVTQRLVDKWQDDPYTLGNVREKDPGWELVGIRQRNAYHLGMRNLDVVLEVNGRKLNTMPQLLAAYFALKNDKSFDVIFVRGGVQKVHHYRIVN